MRRVLLVLCCVLALPLAAQTYNYTGQDLLPSDVYEAFLSLPALRQQVQALQAAGDEPTEEQRRILSKYEQSLKGFMMVEVGYFSCKPCRLLMSRLNEEDASGLSLIEQWKNKGGRFYQLDWSKDRHSRDGENLSALWQVQSVPVLLFFKDGRLQARLNGFNAQNPADALGNIRAWIQSVGQ